MLVLHLLKFSGNPVQCSYVDKVYVKKELYDSNKEGLTSSWEKCGCSPSRPITVAAWGKTNTPLCAWLLSNHKNRKFKWLDFLNKYSYNSYENATNWTDHFSKVLFKYMIEVTH